MTTAIRRRRGTTTQHATFTGLEGEVTVDTTKDTLVVHDGSTAGGHPLAKENNATLTGNVTVSGGTANGVAYLDGSKVLTTGSALTFDGGTVANINGGGTGFSTQDAASNFSILRLGTDTANGYAFFQSGKSGTGTTLPFAWRQDSSEQMRLTSTGLGIGTSSPGAKLDVSGDIIGRATTMRFKDSGNTTQYGAIYADATTFNINAGVNNLLLYSAGTERARIDSSGNLGIGTSSPSSFSGYTTVSINNATNGAILNLLVNGTETARLQAYSGIFNVAAKGAATNLTFETNGSERARITSGGFFKASDAGTYIGSTGAYHELVSSTGSATAAVYIRNTNATSPAGIDLSYSATSPNGTGNTFLYCQDSTALRMSIRSNGGIANYSANDVNLSDRREKTNFAPAKSYLDTICAIPVQTFNYADQNLEEDPGLTLGVVAQDVQAVAPELVMESNWGTEDNPKMRLSIYQTDLQYALMKALQELKAEFDAYKATHP